ncbi:MAG: hypothetical protein ACK4M9_19165 [Anaerobacillus sp.]|uniref:hypothetical protein n=1 Tax=Anaerobacillus sp. TaxID=1872506 RepID=UPI00391BE330
MIKTLYLVIDLIFLGLLIFGLIQSKKYSFLAGVYSFLILLFLRLYSFVAQYTTKLIIDNVSEPPFGFSTSDFVAFINILPRTLNLIAFSILIIGLYQRLKK